MFSCVPPASICWALGRFFMFISSLSEHPVNPGERAHPFQNTKWVQAGSGDFSALLLNENWFPISFLLARCCHLHSHWVPPSHANNPMAINRAVHGRQRKERDTLTPPLSLCHGAWQVGWGAGTGPCFPGAGARHQAALCTEPVWAPLCVPRTLFCSEKLLLLAQFIHPIHNKSKEGIPSSLQRRNTSWEGFVDPVILILCQGSQWTIRYQVQRQKGYALWLSPLELVLLR